MKNIAVLTGASGGIGRCFAKTLSDHGTYDEVWLIARDESGLYDAAALVPFPVRVMPLDLTKEEALEAYKNVLFLERPQISLLINCAGYGKFDAFESLTYEENIGMTDLNCRALTAITYLSLPYMGRGSEIVNISSVAAFQPVPYVGVYAASKAYVLSFSRALAREVGKRGVRVLCVCPFWTDTPFFDRAVDHGKRAVVKKYIAMYEPSYIVKCSWRALCGRREICIPGFVSKMQVLLTKILPHSLAELIWLKQQGL